MSIEEEQRPLDIDPSAKKGEFASKKEELVIREHSFDGIQEYDQPLPNWWLSVLWASIAIFIVYYAIYYSFRLLPTSTESMDQRVEAIHAERNAAIQRTLENLTDGVLVNQWAADPQIVMKGKAIYTQNCVACHSADYQSNGGATARSLVDGVWEHGDNPMDVFNLILKGTPAGHDGYRMMKMPAWGQLGAEQVAQVTAFLISINPEDFKDHLK